MDQPRVEARAAVPARAAGRARAGGGGGGAKSAAGRRRRRRPPPARTARRAPAGLAGTSRGQAARAVVEWFGKKSRVQAPRIEKIVISMGLGKAVTAGEKGKMEQAEKELGVIAGQKPVRCKAKKSVANFKVREGQETGLKVTLRGSRMYEFLDRMISLAIPRVKDFRGLNPDGFDDGGNYNFGFTEQTVFPEGDGAAVTFQQGMNITMVTTARSPDEGRDLLRAFGFPFRTQKPQTA